ncbi:hypothetical protein B0T25DRAFT_574644 [Lasiosphaeria hispida]|uniref:Uncharacterized protein n=1 Tax=Lasiosphaeria hispida TaxID=260671 RepID=A0AAJ0M7Q4_9PEZI|nr:hypothetical protein B0T25DRAFT_574644 [Lasiosphaeria hispida]
MAPDSASLLAKTAAELVGRRGLAVSDGIRDKREAYRELRADQCPEQSWMEEVSGRWLGAGASRAEIDWALLPGTVCLSFFVSVVSAVECGAHQRCCIIDGAESRKHEVTLRSLRALCALSALSLARGAVIVP